MIKTVELSGDMNLMFTDRFIWVRNLSDSTVTVSMSGESVDIPGGHASRFDREASDYDKLTVSGSGTVEIHTTDIPQCPFRIMGDASGGGSGVER